MAAVELQAPARNLGLIQPCGSVGWWSRLFMGRHEQWQHQRRGSELSRFEGDLRARANHPARSPIAKRLEWFSTERGDRKTRSRAAGMGESGSRKHGALSSRKADLSA